MLVKYPANTEKVFANFIKFATQLSNFKYTSFFMTTPTAQLIPTSNTAESKFDKLN